ncbi:MAG: hypothetical protein WEA80_04510 [Gemmatimonadaceae bacterium]
MAGTPFTSITLRNWMFRGVDGSRIHLEDVSLIGHGPYARDDFEQFLSRRKIDTWEPAAYTEVLVLGREEWQARDLDQLLRKRAGKTLRVYSHEMFLAYLISGHDPLNTPKIALRMGKGHPGLEHLMKVGFRWPSIVVRGYGRLRLLSADWRSESFLKAKGYRVGDGAGNHPTSRRRALARAYAGAIPTRFGTEYAADCGSPKSAPRLRRMAYAIAKSYHLGAGRLGSDSTACTQWFRDLRWLKRTYYDRHLQFEWPSVRVGD